MPKLPDSFNTSTNKEGLDDYTALPAGDVIAKITKSSYKQTKKKDGHYLQLIWKVDHGAHKGRTIFDNLNLDNPNPIAVEIANKCLNSICQAAEKVGVEDSEELHDIPIKLTLKVDKATAQNPESNSITAYTKVTEGDLVVVDDAPPQGETAEIIPSPIGSETLSVKETTNSVEPKKKLPWE